MKSSSELFPTQLIKADVIENLSSRFAEDVYLIKPGNSNDHSVQLAVTNLSRFEEESIEKKSDKKRWWHSPAKATENLRSRSVILVHGCYQNKNLWFSPHHKDLIDQLLDKGYDVWLMEHRGHGLSPVNQSYDHNTLEDYAQYDIPAVNDFVTEQTNSKPHWIGYGEGAGSLLLSLASGSITENALSSVTGIGSPFLSIPMSRLPLSHILAQPFNRLQKNASRRGPESEPWALRKQLLKEGGWLTQRGSNLGIDLWQELISQNFPLRWLASPIDLNKLDEGLATLFASGKLDLLDCSLSWGALAPENVHTTMLDTRDVEHIFHLLTDKLEGFVQKNGLLLSGKTSTTI